MREEPNIESLIHSDGTTRQGYFSLVNYGTCAFLITNLALTNRIRIDVRSSNVSSASIKTLSWVLRKYGRGRPVEVRDEDGRIVNDLNDLHTYAELIARMKAKLESGMPLVA